MSDKPKSPQLNLDLEKLKSLPPESKRTIIISVVSCVISLAVGALLLYPSIIEHASEKKLLQEKQEEVDKILNTTKSHASQIKRNRDAENKRNQIIEHGVLSPLAGSLEIGAKNFVDEAAEESGFKIDRIEELSAIDLFYDKKEPLTPYERQPIKFIGRGSYYQITKFIELVESTNPLVCLHALTINANQNSPEVHTTAITFEWPKVGVTRQQQKK